MNGSEISSRYARALFRLSSANGSLEALLEDFNVLVPLLQKPSSFLNFFAAPQIEPREKEAMLKKHFKGEESKMFLDFLLFLLKRGRFACLPEIATSYRQLAQEKLGILDVSMITAIPLDDVTKEKLRVSLEEKFQMKMQIHQKVNPKLLGGGILMIGNKMIDSSVQGKFTKLRKHLLRGTP